MIDGAADAAIEPVVALAGEIADALLRKIGEGISHVVGLLNAFSPEIITLAAVFCAFGVMLSPLWNGGGSKWTGRLFVTLFVGIVWRMLIP